jgi:hypothetical protein
MALHRGEWFNHQTIETDGQIFDACTFVECRLIYRGGELPDISGGQFSGSYWVLLDAAIRTIGFMRALKMAGGGDFVDIWIDIIQGGGDLPNPPTEKVQ